MKELSELVMRRRMVCKRIAERDTEVETLQREARTCASPKREGELVQQIDRLTKQPLDV